MDGTSGSRALDGIWKNRNFDTTTKAILQSFVNELNFKGDFREWRYTSFSQLADGASTSRSTAIRTIGWLVENGYIEKKEDYRPTGASSANHYKLTEKFFTEWRTFKKPSKENKSIKSNRSKHAKYAASSVVTPAAITAASSVVTPAAITAASSVVTLGESRGDTGGGSVVTPKLLPYNSFPLAPNIQTECVNNLEHNRSESIGFTHNRIDVQTLARKMRKTFFRNARKNGAGREEYYEHEKMEVEIGSWIKITGVEWLQNFLRISKMGTDLLSWSPEVVRHAIDFNFGEQGWDKLSDVSKVSENG